MSRSSPATVRKPIASSLAMGEVELNVHDLDAMSGFYQNVIGLETLEERPQSVTLGSRSAPIVTLHWTPGLPPPSRGDAGLYHMAILYASQAGLARAVQRVLTSAPDFFSGSADHSVSQAFYLVDPECNGIELYHDRDPKSWQWRDGTVRMTATYIPPREFIRAHAAGGSDVARLGHVHLKVGDIAKAKRFYVDTLGFDVTARMPSALFVSVNRYHHHLGMNAWESQDAGKRGETLGLRSIEFVLRSRADLAALERRLERRGVPYAATDAGLTFVDPWNNRLRARV